MSKVRWLGLATLATYGVAGVASPQLMLCFHGDGRSQIELASLRCCDAEVQHSDPSCQDGSSRSETAPCPDDQCKDVSLSIGSPPVTPTPAALDLSASLVEIIASAPAYPFLGDETGTMGDGARSLDPPPRSGPMDYLRTVILRL